MSKNTASFIEMPGKDIYFICQMVDRSLSGFSCIRNIEDFMGDMACGRLLDSYPKFTPLHQYIEYVVSEVVWEERNTDSAKLLSEYSRSDGRRLWVDHLLSGHGFDMSLETWSEVGETAGSVVGYFEYLVDSDVLPELTDRVAKEVFHVLFTNRKVLKNFGRVAADRVLEVAPGFYPEKFGRTGKLLRARVPQWARNAVFHRDKGLCVHCHTDLTRLIHQQNALHFDHVIPLARGGMNDVTNLQLLCERCNLGKGGSETATVASYESWYAY